MCVAVSKAYAPMVKGASPSVGRVTAMPMAARSSGTSRVSLRACTTIGPTWTTRSGSTSASGAGSGAGSRKASASARKVSTNGATAARRFSAMRSCTALSQVVR